MQATRWWRLYRSSGYGLWLVRACAALAIPFRAYAAPENPPAETEVPVIAGFPLGPNPFAFHLDVAFGVGSTRSTAAVSFDALYGFGSSRLLRVGLGARYSAAFGGDKVAFTTADASLIRRNQINSLLVSNAQSQSLNAVFHLQFNVIAGLVLGFDIDLIGIGFGITKTGSYTSTNSSFNGDQSASPSSFNLFAGGNPDRGQLNSEFYAAYWFADRWAVRAGVSHFISEYTTDMKLDFGNDRFRHSSTFPFAALSYRLWN